MTIARHGGGTRGDELADGKLQLKKEKKVKNENKQSNLKERN